MKRLFVFDPANDRREAVLAFACDFARKAGRKVHLIVCDPAKSREQEAHYHAQLDDIADQVKGYGDARSAEWWKRVLIDAFRHETKDDPDFSALWVEFGSYELAPAWNNDGVVVIGEQSRKFGSRLASGFIDWLYAFGAEHEVRWSEPNKKRQKESIRSAA